jgi:hypothetical protein
MDLPNNISLPDLATKTLYVFLFSPSSLHAPPPCVFWHVYVDIISHFYNRISHHSKYKEDSWCPRVDRFSSTAGNVHGLKYNALKSNIQSARHPLAFCYNRNWIYMHGSFESSQKMSNAPCFIVAEKGGIHEGSLMGKFQSFKKFQIFMQP